MTDRIQRTYLFDARRAYPAFPEADRYCRSLLPWIAKALKAGESLQVITSDSGTLASLDSLHNVSIHCIPVKPGSIRSNALVHRILKKTAPCLYHGATLIDPFPAGVRSIATVHRNCPLDRDASQSSLFSRLLFRLIKERRLRHCETFIAATETLVRTYASTVVPERSRIIPYGVQSAFVPCREEDIDRVRQKHELPRRFLLLIATGESHKNIAVVLDAVQSTDFTETAPLVIAGYSSRSENITKIIRQRGLSARVHQTGPVADEDMPALYSAAFTLLFPDISSGVGLPVMEAMACGTPVICSSTPVLLELSGGAATLVHPADRLEWRRAISTALLSINWHEESRAAAIERAKIFSWEKAALETLSIYRTLPERNAGSSRSRSASAR